MTDPNCLFCKIINKEIPAKILFENEDLLIFEDIKPAAPIHHLIVPKKHIQSVAHLQETDKDIIANLLLSTKNQAQSLDLKGYKVNINVGREGGQVIDHLHLHLLGGW
jgi:histidine triad (HIT) family protein